MIKRAAMIERAAMMKRTAQMRLAATWATVRALSGDDAYDRYLAHQRSHHPGCEPLSRRAFYLQDQQRRWSGVSRCC